MKFLVFLLAFLSFSCGEKKKEEPNVDKKEVQLVTKPQNLEINNFENGTLLRLRNFEDPEYFEFASTISQAQSNAWGKSLSFGFKPQVDFFDFKDAISTEDYSTSIMIKKISDRFKERCPTSFNQNRALIPLDIIWSNDGNGGSEGYFDPVFEWRSTGYDLEEGQVAQSIIWWKGDEKFRHKLVMRPGKDNSKRKTYFDYEGEEPWEWDYKGFFDNDFWLSQGWLLDAHKGKSYADFTLVHEMGHWFLEDLLLSEGKISAATVYFSESIAQLTSAFCYVAHIENKEALQKQIDYFNEKNFLARWDYEVDRYWPLSNHYFEGDTKSMAREIKTIIYDDGSHTTAEQMSYYDQSNKRFGLTGLIMAYVLEDSYDPDFLASKMFESINEMNGRKLKCRDNDESCARTSLIYNGKEYPESAHPYVLTLAEFLEVFTAKIDVPERAKLMWDSYIKLMNEVEK